MHTSFLFGMLGAMSTFLAFSTIAAILAFKSYKPSFLRFVDFGILATILTFFAFGGPAVNSTFFAFATLSSILALKSNQSSFVNFVASGILVLIATFLIFLTFIGFGKLVAISIFIVFGILATILAFKLNKWSFLTFIVFGMLAGMLAELVIFASFFAEIVQRSAFKSTELSFIYVRISLLLFITATVFLTLILRLKNCSFLTFILTFVAFDTLAVILAFKLLVDKLYQWTFLTSVAFGSLVAPFAFKSNKWVLNKVNLIESTKARLLSKIFYILLLLSSQEIIMHDASFTLVPLPASALEFLKNQFVMHFTSDNYVQFQLTNIPFIEDFSLMAYWISIISIGILFAFIQIWFYLLLLSSILALKNITARCVVSLLLALVFLQKISFGSVFALFLLSFIVISIYLSKPYQTSLKKASSEKNLF
ncbi:MAG: hypothetical protein K9G11_03890 [Rickettsiaceae bacterium]|nr:hypothetical protein [Rickettsiaceae bacterium]